MLAGIKVDEGLEPLEGGEPGETRTRGLETLAARCKGYVAAGAKFAKWRAALRVSPVQEGAAGRALPSDLAVQVNADQLAEYAQICQSAGLVPIVEPELLIDGPHSADAFGAASERVIAACVAALWRRGVALEATLLKPQMVVQGTECADPKAAPEVVAARTLRVLRRVVPPAVAGVMFLSGGQTEEEATLNLDAINKLVSVTYVLCLWIDWLSGSLAGWVCLFVVPHLHRTCTLTRFTTAPCPHKQTKLHNNNRRSARAARRGRSRSPSAAAYRQASSSCGPTRRPRRRPRRAIWRPRSRAQTRRRRAARTRAPTRPSRAARARRCTRRSGG